MACAERQLCFPPLQVLEEVAERRENWAESVALQAKASASEAAAREDSLVVRERELSKRERDVAEELQALKDERKETAAQRDKMHGKSIARTIVVGAHKPLSWHSLIELGPLYAHPHPPALQSSSASSRPRRRSTPPKSLPSRTKSRASPIRWTLRRTTGKGLWKRSERPLRSWLRLRQASNADSHQSALLFGELCVDPSVCTGKKAGSRG